MALAVLVLLAAGGTGAWLVLRQPQGAPGSGLRYPAGHAVRVTGHAVPVTRHAVPVFPRRARPQAGRRGARRPRGGPPLRGWSPSSMPTSPLSTPTTTSGTACCSAPRSGGPRPRRCSAQATGPTTDSAVTLAGISAATGPPPAGRGRDLHQPPGGLAISLRTAGARAGGSSWCWARGPVCLRARAATARLPRLLPGPATHLHGGWPIPQEGLGPAPCLAQRMLGEEGQYLVSYQNAALPGPGSSGSRPGSRGTWRPPRGGPGPAIATVRARSAPGNPGRRGSPASGCGLSRRAGTGRWPATGPGAPGSPNSRTR